MRPTLIAFVGGFEDAPAAQIAALKAAKHLKNGEVHEFRPDIHLEGFAQSRADPTLHAALEERLKTHERPPRIPKAKRPRRCADDTRLGDLCRDVHDTSRDVVALMVRIRASALSIPF
jgi:hypothetical protein